ncbi:hypothetical protein KIPE111705_45675 [Kibdelosporangium persicum]|uniref:Lipoprotein n=1 Tax=Kibdelosporangium persicum TaxID=2698649 RepID=A0ABX2FDB4_9PSEU|nr:hypothetical protein [Kibdelosporangium persicum]NRN69366.1 hypothetical protein [Kibdelosporangium persicum]
MKRILSVLALLALLGACGSTDNSNQGIASAGGNGSSAPPTSTSQPGDSGEQMQKFAKCMRDNGVDVPDPEPGGGLGNWDESKVDRDSPAFQKAMEACKSFLPGGGDLSKLDPKLVDQVRELTQCLRANGIDVPDPDPNSPTLGMDAMKDIDRDSPAFQKAMEACKDKVPGRFGQ